ncbi:unnamed protein product [Closterium sp. Naga37s-1]|nr:unnamed protein product [Closterium sp. Naga37s-1]
MAQRSERSAIRAIPFLVLCLIFERVSTSFFIVSLTHPLYSLPSPSHPHTSTYSQHPLLFLPLLLPSSPRNPPFLLSSTPLRLSVPPLVNQVWESIYGLHEDNQLPPANISLPPNVPPAPHLEDCAARTAFRLAAEQRGANGEPPEWARPPKCCGCNPQPPWVRGADDENLAMTRRVQKEIWENQFPAERKCAGRKVLVVQWAPQNHHGVGSQVHVMGAFLSIALQFNRTLVAIPGSYGRAEEPGCKAAGQYGEWECFFFSFADPACQQIVREMKDSKALQCSHSFASQVAGSSDVVACLDYMPYGDLEMKANITWRWGGAQWQQPDTVWHVPGSESHKAHTMQVHWWRAQAARFMLRWPSAYLCHVTNRVRHSSYGHRVAARLARFDSTRAEILRELAGDTAGDAARSNIKLSPQATAAAAVPFREGSFKQSQGLFPWAHGACSKDACGGGGEREKRSAYLREMFEGVGGEPYVMSPIVSLHVRQSDKVEEMQLMPLSLYIFYLNRLRLIRADLSYVWLNTESQVNRPTSSHSLLLPVVHTPSPSVPHTHSPPSLTLPRDNEHAPSPPVSFALAPLSHTRALFSRGLQFPPVAHAGAPRPITHTPFRHPRSLRSRRRRALPSVAPAHSVSYLGPRALPSVAHSQDLPVAHAHTLPIAYAQSFRRPLSITSLAHARSLPVAHAHSLSIAFAQSLHRTRSPPLVAHGQFPLVARCRPRRALPFNLLPPSTRTPSRRARRLPVRRPRSLPPAATVPSAAHAHSPPSPTPTPYGRTHSSPSPTHSPPYPSLTPLPPPIVAQQRRTWCCVNPFPPSSQPLFLPSSRPSSPHPLLSPSSRPSSHHVPSSPHPLLFQTHPSSSHPSSFHPSSPHPSSPHPSCPHPLLSPSAPGVSSHHHFLPSSLPPITTSSHHHFLPSPLPPITTSSHHHFLPSPLPPITTSSHHHFLPSSLPPITTSSHHHFLPSPLPPITTSSHHHFLPSPLPPIITSSHHHFLPSPLPPITTSFHHHFLPSPLPLPIPFPSHIVLSPPVPSPLLPSSPSFPAFPSPSLVFSFSPWQLQ